MSELTMDYCRVHLNQITSMRDTSAASPSLPTSVPTFARIPSYPHRAQCIYIKDQTKWNRDKDNKHDKRSFYSKAVNHQHLQTHVHLLPLCAFKYFPVENALYRIGNWWKQLWKWSRVDSINIIFVDIKLKWRATMMKCTLQRYCIIVVCLAAYRFIIRFWFEICIPETFTMATHRGYWSATIKGEYNYLYGSYSDVDIEMAVGDYKNIYAILSFGVES